MAKNVFKPTEVMYQSRKLFIEPPHLTTDEPEDEPEALEEAI